MRLDNWQNNLSLFIEEKRNVPFDFPNWNCLFWTIGCVEQVIGQDYLAAYRGQFKTEKGAAKLLRKIDKVDTSQAFLEKYFGEVKPVAFARKGDIVLVDPEETGLDLPADAALFGTVPGICYGTISYFLGENGLVEFETLRLGGSLWVS